MTGVQRQGPEAAAEGGLEGRAPEPLDRVECEPLRPRREVRGECVDPAPSIGCRAKKEMFFSVHLKYKLS